MYSRVDIGGLLVVNFLFSFSLLGRCTFSVIFSIGGTLLQGVEAGVLFINYKKNDIGSSLRRRNQFFIPAYERTSYTPPQGFRKIDTDRWEFANAGFLRGNRHLLRNIQRRRSAHSQQLIGSFSGSSSETGQTDLEGEVEKLKKEKNALMLEIVDLRQEHQGMAQRLEMVNQRLQAAEQRQKQMVSFLAKVLQNPEFVARLKEKKENREFGYPKLRRKFVKHRREDQGKVESSLEGQLVSYGKDSNPSLDKQLPDQLLQDMVGELEPSVEHMLFDIGEGPSRGGPDEAHSKGKQVAEASTEYFVSFPEDSEKEKDFREILPSGIESIVKQEDIWDMGFDPSSSNELWGNFGMSELGAAVGLSDIWDLNSLQNPAGPSGLHRWPSCDGSHFDELERKNEDDDSKDMDR